MKIRKIAFKISDFRQNLKNFSVFIKEYCCFFYKLLTWQCFIQKSLWDRFIYQKLQK